MDNGELKMGNCPKDPFGENGEGKGERGGIRVQGTEKPQKTSPGLLQTPVPLVLV